MSFPGAGMGMYPGSVGTAGMTADQIQQLQMQKYIAMGMESCAGKSILSGVMGTGLGAMFGLFMSSMRYDTPMSLQGAGAAEATKLTTREQIRQGFREMGRASWSSAKNFGKLGFLYSGIECGIEGFRGTNSAYNNVAAGFLTGGIIARNAGPQAMVVGAGGFGLFSAAIEWYLRMESNDPAREPIT